MRDRRGRFIGVIVNVVVESFGDSSDGQIERTIGFVYPGNSRCKNPGMCSDGINNRVCYRIEKGLGVTVLSSSTFRMVNVVVLFCCSVDIHACCECACVRLVRSVK